MELNLDKVLTLFAFDKKPEPEIPDALRPLATQIVERSFMLSTMKAAMSLARRLFQQDIRTETIQSLTGLPGKYLCDLEAYAKGWKMLDPADFTDGRGMELNLDIVLEGVAAVGHKLTRIPDILRPLLSRLVERTLTLGELLGSTRFAAQLLEKGMQ